ncbi:hypothetical protein LCGC14_0408890 [marine sediment metagenome]|uniref:Uncharacterized protein n=1 Tax=marine sediment metagenome TaxID=412755 RepID=A0A0F9TCI7_9ZZZZ
MAEQAEGREYWAGESEKAIADNEAKIEAQHQREQDERLLTPEEKENKLVEMLCARNGWDFPSGNADCEDYDTAVRDVKWFIKNYSQLAKIGVCPELREILALKRRADGIFEIYADGKLVEEYEIDEYTQGAVLPIKMWRHFNSIIEKRIKELDNGN